MIVNPQPFNYRLIIGSLVLVIVILGFYNYNSFINLKNQETFVKQENQLVQSELSKMIDNYNIINGKNDRVNLELEATKDKLSRMIDSIKIVPKKVSLISHNTAKVKSNKLSIIKAYYEINDKSNNAFFDDSQGNDIDFLKHNSAVKSSKDKESQLPKIINYGLINNAVDSPKKTITIKNIKAQGVKKITPKQRIISTKTASKANQLHVSFTIDKSEMTNFKMESVYIQILDSKNNIVGDKGVVSFGNQNLIYSEKAIVDSKDDDLKISKLIKASKREPLIKGSYLVNVFHNTTRVANTTINLK